GGKGQVALLSGEAGIGKSRISKTLLDRIADDAHVTIRLQCSPYHTNSPLIRLSPPARTCSASGRLDPPEVKLEKLEALLSQIGSEIVPTPRSTPPCCRFQRKDAIRPWS